MSASTHQHSHNVNVSHMSEEEVLQFESVLNRNDAVNSMEINRIRRLKNSPPTPLRTHTPPRVFQSLVCQKCGSLCLSPSLVLSTRSMARASSLCRVCRSLLCRACWGRSPDNRLNICGSCYQRIVLDAKTGNWFHQQFKTRLSKHTSLHMEPTVPETISERHSPKRNLLRRLRSFNSVQEELSDGDDRFMTGTRRSSGGIGECDPPMCQSYHINTEQSSEEHRDLQNVPGHGNYYRPLSHITTNPLKSSSNGSPVPEDDSWRSIVHDNSTTDNYITTTSPSDSGEVLIELDFNFRMSQFIVVLRQCRNLPSVDPCSKSICPYLFILLLPDRSKRSRRTTSVKKNTSSPTYDQIFKYSINFSELESRSLLVMLCHKDDHSTRDLALGQVIIGLSFLDFSKPLTRWYSFQVLNHGNVTQPRYERSMSNVNQKRSNIPPYFGEISLALKYVPRQPSSDSMGGELHVWIKSMRNIASHQWTSSPCASPSTRRFSTTDSSEPPEDNNFINGFSIGSSRLINAVTQLAQNPPVARVCLLPYRTHTQSTEPARCQTENGMHFTWSTIVKFQNVDLDELRTRSMEVTVWVNCRHGWMNKLIQSKCMGGVRLSRGSGGGGGGSDCSRGVSTGVIEEKMWTAMLERPSTWIDGTARLKMESSFMAQ